MFQAAKGFKKEDLLYVAEEIGATLPQKLTISELKGVILKSEQYLEDPQFVTDILITTISDRKKKEDEELKRLEYEEQKKIKRLEYEEQEKIKRLEYEEQEKIKRLEYEEQERIRHHELELARIARINSVGEIQNPVTSDAKKKFDLPKLEFRQFNGDLKDWLPFWSQFQHIHNDEDIAPENKFQYLIQATVSGSRARDIVESFPPTGTNYAKAVESLKDRFGREELLIEIYVRELLKLIHLAHKNEKLSMTSLYDKLETYLRALETLGVTTDKCASIIYPMVESCFKEDFLKAWNRSASYAASTDAKDRLNNLLAFLKMETEGEERINLAMAGFGLDSNENRQPFKKKDGYMNTAKMPYMNTAKMPTATSLLATKEDLTKSCVFCSGKHSSSDCFKAQEMSLDERKEILWENQCCFACLKPGHRVRNCKVFIKCMVCGRRHLPIICESLNDQKLQNAISEKDEEKCESPEISMSNITNGPNVFLQTLKIKVVSKDKEVLVRAILDSGSQKTYILKSLAEQMEYVPLRKQPLTHSLFGGLNSDQCVHTCYKIRLRNPENNITCKMEALDQGCICENITAVSTGPWLKELQKMKITLSDIGDESQPVQVLLGADVIGKLMTGRRKVLTCGLVAMETLLGWTLSGKVPGNNTSYSNSMMVTSLLVKDMDNHNAVKSDFKRIKDTSENKNKEDHHETSIEHLSRKVKVGKDRRFLLNLPQIGKRLSLLGNFKFESYLKESKRSFTEKMRKPKFGLKGWEFSNVTAEESEPKKLV